LKGALRTGLRTVIERYELPVRLTANQVCVCAGYHFSYSN
jgi:hypothetical protein